MIPYKKLILHTALTPQEVTEKLKQNTSYTNQFSFLGLQSSDSAFTGTIDNENFKIRRVISYKNSFLPVIYGQLKKAPEGTFITLTFKLPIFVMIFMIIWMGGVAIGCASVFTHFFEEEEMTSKHLTPFGMLFFGYLLTTVAFMIEYNIGLKKLKQMLNSKRYYNSFSPSAS